LNGVQGAGGSNPLIPTIESSRKTACWRKRLHAVFRCIPFHIPSMFPILFLVHSMGICFHVSFPGKTGIQEKRLEGIDAGL
ncbi:MAG: hypothetical protein ACLFNV_03025, partial [Desulfovibrionales bacterium]